MSKKEKLYFKNEDDNFCKPISDIIEGLEPEETTVTVLEAIPDNSNSDFIWCSKVGEVSDKSECTKANCRFYNSKSGRGVCASRGKLYTHGERVTFDVGTTSILSLSGSPSLKID